MSSQDSVPAAAREQFLEVTRFPTQRDDPVRACVRKAYLDMSRTLHGFGSLAHRDEIRAETHEWVSAELQTIVQPDARVGVSQEAFDSWHQRTVLSLRRLYHECGFGGFAVGQGQKWVNMSLKYAVALGEEILPGIDRLTRWAHVPLDNVVLSAPECLRAPTFATRWSRLDDYERYFAFQAWFREAFPDRPPLATEFKLWQEGMNAGRGPASA